jgi:hypothetical protein
VSDDQWPLPLLEQHRQHKRAIHDRALIWRQRLIELAERCRNFLQILLRRGDPLLRQAEARSEVRQLPCHR